MRFFMRLGGPVVVGLALAGCAQITVTSDTLVDGTARIADETTDAVRGTSNITSDTADEVDARTHAARRRFVQSQYAMLKREAARGSGEHLDTLAYMMHAGNTQAFDARVQANYARLFADDNHDAERWLDRLYRALGTPPDMRRATGGTRG